LVFVEVLEIPGGVGRFHFFILTPLPLVTSPDCRRLSRGGLISSGSLKSLDQPRIFKYEYSCLADIIEA
ncbi:MAG: hypothetical protein VYB15_10500, partial [Planctomycetota bacterium]|nr:hypothetical protein [Planctomycetota bacterium]